MIPKVINVCGVPHAIKLVEDNFPGDSHFGEIDYTKAEIHINKDMPEEMQMQTLVHEWMRAALVMIGYTLETNDEHLVQGLAMAINQTFDLKKGKTK